MDPLISQQTRHAHSLIILLLALAASRQSSGQASVPEFDVRTAQASEPALHFSGGSATAGGLGGSGEIHQPIRVVISRRDLSDCKEGKLSMDVRIDNLTQSSLTLPWNPDGARVVVPPGEGGEDLATLDISIIGRDGAVQGKPLMLYGNQLIPGSQMTVLPGHSALFRNLTTGSARANVCEETMKVVATLFMNHVTEAKDGSYWLRSSKGWSVRSQ